MSSYPPFVFRAIRNNFACEITGLEEVTWGKEQTAKTSRPSLQTTVGGHETGVPAEEITKAES
jgi:hypothetical protein